MQSPPLLCKYFTWIDLEVPEDVKKDQYADCLRRQRRFEESFRRGLEEERRQKERMERKQREERAHQAKLAHEEERARKLAKARKAQEEDEARDKKGKWPCMTQ